MALNPHNHRFFVTRSGRHYVLAAGKMWFYDGTGEVKKWSVIERDLDSVASDGRLMEVDSADEFIHHARQAYIQHWGVGIG